MEIWKYQSESKQKVPKTICRGAWSDAGAWWPPNLPASLHQGPVTCLTEESSRSNKGKNSGTCFQSLSHSPRDWETQFSWNIPEIFCMQLRKAVASSQASVRPRRSSSLSLPGEIIAQCRTIFPFQWQTDAIKYLGIQLTARLSDLYSKNYIPILHSISEDLRRWDKSSFTWFGRMAMLKMNIPSHVLYILKRSQSNSPRPFSKLINVSA